MKGDDGTNIYERKIPIDSLYFQILIGIWKKSGIKCFSGSKRREVCRKVMKNIDRLPPMWSYFYI